MSFKHSYSTTSTFITCPKQFYHKNVIKDIKFKQNPAAKYGSLNHDVCDKSIKSMTLPTEPEFQFIVPALKSLFQAANGIKIESELAYGLDENKSPTDFFEGWLRGKLDVEYKPAPDKAVILDHKFAAFDEKKYNLELDVFSYLEFLNNPEVDTIKRVLMWYKPYNKPDGKHPPTVSIVRRKEDLQRIEDEVCGSINEVERALQTGDFPEKRGGLCQSYCDVKTCKFNGKYKP